MIDQKFIESAIQIRKAFLLLSKELEQSEKSVEDMKTFIKDKVNDLENFRDITLKNAKTRDDVISVTKELHAKISEIEEKEKSLSKTLKDIDEKMSKLKNEEMNLLKSIQNKYPNLSVKEIRSQVHSKIDF